MKPVSPFSPLLPFHTEKMGGCLTPGMAGLVSEPITHPQQRDTSDKECTRQVAQKTKQEACGRSV